MASKTIIKSDSNGFYSNPKAMEAIRMNTVVGISPECIASPAQCCSEIDLPQKSSTLEKQVASKPLIPLVWHIATPGIISTIIGALYSSIDSLYIGRYSGNSLAAIGVAFPAEQLIIWNVGVILNFGCGTLISRALGKKNISEAEKYLGSVIFSWIVISILVPLLVIPFALPIVRAFGADTTIEDEAASYLKIIAVGTYAYTMTASGNNLPRSEGSALCAMVISIVSAILNIIIDPILIFGFDMGLKGAA
ncbi:Multi antimicrobial extrusion protein like protein, partial [Aduncisulcus paluster]